MNNKNILIIYVDQLARDFLSCYGCEEIATPSIDSLAKDGVILNNFYTPSAVCTPSRGTFLTGNYPFVNGAWKNGMAVNKNQKGVAEIFRNNGYTTGYIGKWHLSKALQMSDDLKDFNNLGFDIWDYKIEIGHCKSIKETNGGIVTSKTVGDEKSYTTDWLADKTIDFIHKYSSDKRPFFFMLSIPDPHQPFSVRAPYDKMFDPLKMRVPPTFDQKKLPDWAEQDEWGRNHYFPLNLFDRRAHFCRMKSQYLGEIKCIDDNVGKIILALKQAGIYDDTLIVFTSDHGDYMGQHGLVEKNNLYDDVYKLPMILKDNDICKNGKEYIDTYMTTVDFPLTIAKLAGLRNVDFTCDGFDCSDIFKDDKAVISQEVYIHPSDCPRAGIITPEYELAYVGKGFNDGVVFYDHILFDRINDPNQVENLFEKSEYAAVISELRNKIIAHHKKYKTPLNMLPKEVWYE